MDLLTPGDAQALGEAKDGEEISAGCGWSKRTRDGRRSPAQGRSAWRCTRWKTRAGSASEDGRRT